MVEQIRGVGADPDVQARVLDAVREQRGGRPFDESDLRRVLALWDDVWTALLPSEQVRLMRLLVERVAYDGRAGTVAVTFHPTGIAALAAEVSA